MLLPPRTQGQPVAPSGHVLLASRNYGFMAAVHEVGRPSTEGCARRRAALEVAGTAPMNSAILIPTATMIRLARLRCVPCNETKPPLRAPIAAATPADTRPVAWPTTRALR
jgi:hypothetical protein